jgi:23S rRNA pseudouridine1911/1915/1917 synthase
VPTQRSLTVPPGEAGQRVDVFLAGALALSRAAVRRLLTAGGVALDGRPLALSDKGTALAPGQRLVVERAAPGSALPEPQPELGIGVLARGEGWLAIDKPAGMPVHPLRPGEVGTALNAVIALAPEIAGVGEAGLRSGVVHRLDVATSGALLFGTSEARWQMLREGFRAHRVEKRYRALVCGVLAGSGELAVQLSVAQHRPARVRVVAEGDAPAVHGSRRTTLRWRSLEALRGATLVEVEPRTGFLHQIRASLAHLGHPVMGDLAYGAPATALASRQLLHAAYVAYRDVEAASPDPADFAAALAALAMR